MCETGTGQQVAQLLDSYMMMMMMMMMTMIPTTPLARHRLRNVLFSHTSHLTRRLIVEFWFLKKKLNFVFRIIFSIFNACIFICSPFEFVVGPKNVVGPRHSA
jgi:hypothetical protein